MVKIDNGAGAEPSDQLLWSIKTVILKTGLSRAVDLSLHQTRAVPAAPPCRSQPCRLGTGRGHGLDRGPREVGAGPQHPQTRPATEPRSPSPSAHLKSENARETPCQPTTPSPQQT